MTKLLRRLSRHLSGRPIGGQLRAEAGTVDHLLRLGLQVFQVQRAAAQQHHLVQLAQRIQATSRDVLNINAGSLYPALYRLEARDLIRSEWAESKTGRQVKVYSVTAAGRKALVEQRDEWARFAGALSDILKVT